MPSVCHDGVSSRIVTAIDKWLTAVEEDRVTDGDTSYSDTTRNAAKNTESAGSGQIQFEYRNSTYHPDASYRYPGLTFPGLVIEMAWSQPFSDLRRKAERYIKFSNGGIRTVVGINLNDIYKHEDGERGHGKGMFSVWHGEFNATTGKHQVNPANVDQVFFSLESQAK